MAAATVQSSTNLFRQLAWNASVPIEIRLADGEAPGAAVDKYYVSRDELITDSECLFGLVGAQ